MSRFAIGTLVKARGREWVVLPESQDDLVMLRPLAGVTEEVTGVDLVEWMIKQAAGELDLSKFKPAPCGASIQVRLYAEDPNKNLKGL